jgi:hypothetical protein
MTTTATPESSTIVMSSLWKTDENFFCIHFQTSTMELNPTTEPNNTYIIVLATVLPVISIATIGIAICIKKCSSKKKISPSAFELNQRPPPPFQT